MKIFLLFSIVLLGILFISKKIIYSAKRNLFKDQAAWSGKDIKIKHNSPKRSSESTETDNYLKIIAAESTNYLEDHSTKEDE